jgi:hypothetical protein
MVAVTSSAVLLVLSFAHVAAAQDPNAVLVMVESRAVDAGAVRHAVQDRFEGTILGLADEGATRASRQLTIAVAHDGSALTFFYQDSFDRRIVQTHRRERGELLPWVADLAALLLRDTAPPRWFIISEVIDPFLPGNFARRGEVIDPFVTPRLSGVIDPWAMPPARRRVREGARGLDRPPPP